MGGFAPKQGKAFLRRQGGGSGEFTVPGESYFRACDSWFCKRELALPKVED